MIAYRIVGALSRPLLRGLFDLRAEGGDRLPEGPVIVVANHDSLSDPLFLGAAVERRLRFVAKEELWSNRAVGWLLDSLGGIPVRRGRGDLEAFAAAARALGEAEAVAIFPQGTTLGGIERRWHRGAARLALATGAPVVPIRIMGTGRVLQPGTRLPRRAAVRIVIGDPIPVTEAKPTIAAARQLTAQLRESVEGLA